MEFDRSTLLIKPLAERVHDLGWETIKPLARQEHCPEPIRQVAMRVIRARKQGSAVVFMMGGHVIRAGVQRFLIDLLERGYITCLAMNGSCAIHDYEFSLIGATTESVACYIKDGRFGLWQETGCMNDIINRAAKEKETGLGQAVGRAIATGAFPYGDASVLAACYRLGIPATVHVGIGYDIIHEHPNCSGAATGETSYRDFLTFAKVLEGLEGGVVMNFGSAVMAPEVYLKALSMVRNAAARKGGSISRFTTLVCDLHDLPEDFSAEPSKDSAAYYFRPWKTMLVRTVADGGESFYAKGRHDRTIPALWSAIMEENNEDLRS